jgi:hypothetical protein
VPTEIYFAADRVAITVDEDPGRVAEVFAATDRGAVRLTRQGGGEVYINPETVAFWVPSETGPDADRQEDSAETSVRRDTVTDIWGNPISKRRRR